MSSTPQDRANVSLDHFWLARRCYPNNHAKRLALFERLEAMDRFDQLYLEKKLRVLSQERANG